MWKSWRIKHRWLCAVILLAGCPASDDICPTAVPSFEPPTIPPGQSEAQVSILIQDPNPELGREVIFELSTDQGSLTEGPAGTTTFGCAHDVTGPVDVCATARYAAEDDDSEAEALTTTEPEISGVGQNEQFIREPHVRLANLDTCSETVCAEVECPGVSNICPVISSLEASPRVVPTGGTAAISILAEDPDTNPSVLVTTLSAERGAFGDPSARSTSYVCDPNVGGTIEICVVASDGDASCDVEQCTTVECPGDPSGNECPVVREISADPAVVPPGQSQTAVTVDAFDPDREPEELLTELSSETGIFGNRNAAATSFTCGDPGPVELCVTASDGDPTCERTSCITVQCPSTIPPNICPRLFLLNAIPTTIPPGEVSTSVQSRAQDNDGKPMPLELTMRTLWGTISNDENILLPNDTVTQDATYTCDRPGDVEICVDATDGACMKTLCIEVTCPDDIPPPP